MLKNITNKHPKLYIDMDGTLAEWRQFVVNIETQEESYNDSKTIDDKISRILYTPGYFRSLKPHKNMVDAVKFLIAEGDIDVYIMSCVLPDMGSISPLAEKNEWIDKYLPEIDQKHRIFVPNGQNKANYVIGNGPHILLDDYTKNCKEFSYIGKSIKLLNNINENKGTWDGSCISYDAPVEEIVQDLKSFILKDIEIRHSSPVKGGEIYDADAFIRGVENLMDM